MEKLVKLQRWSVMGLKLPNNFFAHESADMAAHRAHYSKIRISSLSGNKYRFKIAHTMELSILS